MNCLQKKHQPVQPSMAQSPFLPQGPCGWLPPQCGGSLQGQLAFFPAHICTGLMPPRGQEQNFSRTPFPLSPPFQNQHRPPVQPPPWEPPPFAYNPRLPPFMEPRCPPFGPPGGHSRDGFPSPLLFAPLNAHPFPPRGPGPCRGAQKKNRIKKVLEGEANLPTYPRDLPTLFPCVGRCSGCGWRAGGRGWDEGTCRGRRLCLQNL